MRGCLAGALSYSTLPVAHTKEGTRARAIRPRFSAHSKRKGGGGLSSETPGNPATLTCARDAVSPDRLNGGPFARPGLARDGCRAARNPLQPRNRPSAAVRPLCVHRCPVRRLRRLRRLRRGPAFLEPRPVHHPVGRPGTGPRRVSSDRRRDSRRQRGRSQRSDHASGRAHPVHSRIATSSLVHPASAPRRQPREARPPLGSRGVDAVRAHQPAHVRPALPRKGARDGFHEREALIRGPCAREGDDEGAGARGRSGAAHLARSPDLPSAGTMAGSSARGPWQS